MSIKDQKIQISTRRWMMETTESLNGNLGTMPIAFKNFSKATFPQLLVLIEDNIKLSH